MRKVAAPLMVWMLGFTVLGCVVFFAWVMLTPVQPGSRRALEPIRYQPASIFRDRQGNLTIGAGADIPPECLPDKDRVSFWKAGRVKHPTLGTNW